MTPQIQKERQLPGGTMTDWNVVITAGDPAGYRAARRKLRRLGEIERTDFHNVMVMRVCDVTDFLKTLEEMIEKDPGFLDDVSRIVPAHAAFDFVSVAAFETESRRIVLGWAERLTGSTFHVRLHRRGHKSELSLLGEERFLDDVILDRTAELGSAARLCFTDPDFIIDVETVDNRAALSLWTREDRSRLPFLRID